MSVYSDKVLADRAVAYWRLDEASGNFIDKVAGVAAVPAGGITYSQPGATSDADAAALFNGTTGKATATGFNPLSGLAAVTVSAWVNHGGVAWSGGGTYEMVLDFGGNKHYFAAFNGVANGVLTISGVARSVVSANPIPTSGWHLLTLTWASGGDLKMYVDGVLASVAGTTYAGTLDSAATVIIGNGGASTFFNGSLDEPAIYGTALSATQIDTQYEIGSLRSINTHLQKYFKEVLYVGTASNDMTTNLVRRMAALTGDVTARMKAIIVSSGTKN